MVSPFWNFVTFKMFWDGMCMSRILMRKLSIALWITSRPLLCNTEFIRPNWNYICAATTWCRVALLSPSNHDLDDVKCFFFIFICGGHVDVFNFCFTTIVQFYFEKLLQKWRFGYTFRSFCCTDGSRTNRTGATSPGPTRQTGYVARQSRARPSGVTHLGPTGHCDTLARLVASIGLVRLPQDLLGYNELWHDWQSCHMVQRDTWSWHKSRQTGWHDLYKSATGCVRPLLLGPLLRHDVTTLDVRIPPLALAWRWCGPSHRRSVV
jgi:hypothetical protein